MVSKANLIARYLLQGSAVKVFHQTSQTQNVADLSSLDEKIMVNSNTGKDHSVRGVIALQEIHEDSTVDGRVDVRLWAHLGQAEGVVGEGCCVDGL